MPLLFAPVLVCEPTSARCKACRGGPGRMWRYFVEALVHDPHLAHIALFKRRTRPVGLKRFDRSPFPHSSLAISQSVSLRHACSKRWALGRSRRPRSPPSAGSTGSSTAGSTPMLTARHQHGTALPVQRVDQPLHLSMDSKTLPGAPARRRTHSAKSHNSCSARRCSPTLPAVRPRPLNPDPPDDVGRVRVA
jgi:hypothetical protein